MTEGALSEGEERDPEAVLGCPRISDQMRRPPEKCQAATFWCRPLPALGLWDSSEEPQEGNQLFRLQGGGDEALSRGKLRKQAEKSPGRCTQGLPAGLE